MVEGPSNRLQRDGAALQTESSAASCGCLGWCLIRDDASQGLRTLVLATRVLTEAEWAAWNEGYQAAAASLDGREARIAAEASKVERHLQLVGVTAIEDKLQDGVPEAIQLLVTAGIKARTHRHPLSVIPTIVLSQGAATAIWLGGGHCIGPCWVVL